MNPVKKKKKKKEKINIWISVLKNLFNM